jgi:hypothetical protein
MLARPPCCGLGISLPHGSAALDRSDFPQSSRVLALVLRFDPSQSRFLPLLGGPLTLIRDTFALIGEFLPVVCDPLTLVGDQLPLVRDALALILQPFALIRFLLALIRYAL